MFIGTKAVAYAPFLIGGILLGFAAPLAPHAMAAVTDISPPQNLAKNMGLLTGLGLQFGLLCGCVVALLIIVANQRKQDDDPTITNIDRNFAVLEQSFMWSFIIGLTGLLALFVFFKETLPKDQRSAMDWKSANPLSGMWRVTRTKYFFCCGLLIFVGAFAAAASESMFLNWIVTRFSLYKWKRNENLCPRTLIELNAATSFNISDDDTQGSGFRCCSWDANLHGHAWTPADWGSPGAAFMPAGSASGVLADGVTVGLSGAADRGSLLAPVLLRADGATCMSTPGDYFSCAGFTDARARATAMATAATQDPTSAIFQGAANAYANTPGALTPSDAGYAAALTPYLQGAATAAVPQYILLHFIGHPGLGIAGTKKTFGAENNAGCGDPTVPDDEACPGLGFPICIPDGVDLSRVMVFLLPFLLQSLCSSSPSVSLLRYMLLVGAGTLLRLASARQSCCGSSRA